MQAGLDLLTNAALTVAPATTITPVFPRSYNPAAMLSPKLVKRILNLDFVEMAEITRNDYQDPTPGRPHTTRPPIQDIYQWVERYTIMAGILVSRFPDKASELFAYLATIIRAERNFQPGTRGLAQPQPSRS